MEDIRRFVSIQTHTANSQRIPEFCSDVWLAWIIRISDVSWWVQAKGALNTVEKSLAFHAKKKSPETLERLRQMQTKLDGMEKLCKQLKEEYELVEKLKLECERDDDWQKVNSTDKLEYETGDGESLLHS